jgi:hypothetical protein
MTVQIIAAPPALTGAALLRSLGRWALVAISISFVAMSASAFGADPATGSSRSITGASQVTPIVGPTTVQPNPPPPDTKLDHLAAHARVVDRLYEELMRRAPPACASTSTDGSKVGGC